MGSRWSLMVMSFTTFSWGPWSKLSPPSRWDHTHQLAQISTCRRNNYWPGCTCSISPIRIRFSLSFQIEDRAPFRKVYYVSSSRDLNQVDWNAEFNGHSINLPVCFGTCTLHVYTYYYMHQSIHACMHVRVNAFLCSLCCVNCTWLCTNILRCECDVYISYMYMGA